MRVQGQRAVRAVVVALLALPVAGIAPAGAAPLSKGGPPVPVLDWQPCGAEFPSLQCTTATVPLDYDHPQGRTTQLALAKRPATDRAHRIGSVFINPGGPGGSGVDLVLFGFGDELGENLHGRFDVVGFDPRGVAASDPLHCFDSEAELDEFFADQPIFPYMRRQERPFFNRYSSLARECLDDRQEVVRHMSTADVARDMDVLRRAVGDAKLSYLGFSYGSYIGNTYANLFPNKVRALVIDGVLDPRLWSSGWQIKSDRVATGQVFNEFLRLCDVAGPECAFSAPRGSKARWERLADTLRRRPLVLDDGFVYSYDFLIGDATGATYAPEVWDDYAVFLDEIADAVLGDQAATPAIASMRARLLRQLTPGAREADYPNFTDAYYGNQCADTEYPSSFGAFRAIGAYAERESRFGPLWWWQNAGCAKWPTAPDRYTGPWTANTSAPILVVGNYFDPATDYAGAQASDRLLGNSRILSYAGWGHTAYLRSDCATRYIDAYLVKGVLPARGTVCPANPNPFLPTDAARAQASSEPLVGLPSQRTGRR